jgi:hypothetical protein
MRFRQQERNYRTGAGPDFAWRGPVFLHRASLAVLLLAAIPFGAAEKPKKAQVPAAAPVGEYVGSAACSRCHLAIAHQFAKTSMGRSLTPISPDFLKTLPLPASFYDPNSGHHFEVHAENGKLYQTDYATAAPGPDGKPGPDIFRNTHELEWIVGTGENGFGALLRREGYLFQAPLSYYSRAGQWALSPGYQNGDYGFNRVILPGCIYCHSGRPQPIAGHLGQYAAIPFTQTAVGCENCHGPGSAHVQAMHEGEEDSKGPDPTIANPARLSPRLSDDICLSCHQTGDARVLQPGKTYQDFRPGEPLDKTVSVFQIPPSRENPPQDDHVEHYYSMTLSKCYLGSLNTASPMRCITCHDPHVEPTGADIPAFYNGKCSSCHATDQHAGQEKATKKLIASACTAPLAARQATTPADNCIGCHMPKRDVVVISHSSITNHRILARPDEPFPDVAFAQTTPAMPDLIHLNPAPGDKAPPTLLTRLQAYDLLRVKKADYDGAWRRVLSEIESTGDSSGKDNAIVQAALGRRDLDDHKVAEAVEHLKRSLELDPLQPEVFSELSEAADQLGNAEEAIALAQKAVALDPFAAPRQKTVISRLINGKRYEEAEAAMEKYLQNFPEDDFMRKMLAIAKQ